MALTVVASGTLTANVGTEQTLLDTTNSGTYVGVTDLVNMQNGDTVELRIYTKVLVGSALDAAYFQTFSGAQPATQDLVQFSIPVPSDQEIKFTLKQTAGVARNYDYKVFTL